jgi:LacI family transcriptional regulator
LRLAIVHRIRSGQARRAADETARANSAIALLLRSGHSFDAVFCGSDQIARGVLDALRESGRRVPDDAAVVGVDNWEVMAQTARPPLTTVDLNLHELGRVAAAALLRAIEGHTLEAGVRFVPCQLVTRQSTEIPPMTTASPR